jgi:hypothetical protein
MSLSISSASNSYADLTALKSLGGATQAGGDNENGAAAAATSGTTGADSAQGAQSVGGQPIQSNSVSPAASGGSANPPPPAASGRGQLLDIAA